MAMNSKKKPMKNDKKETGNGGLTDAQNKIPPALQKAILAKKKK